MDSSGSVLIEVAAELDGSFKDSPRVKKKFEVNPMKDKKFIDVAKDGGGHWSVGIICAEGKFQSFFWLDGPPLSNNLFAKSPGNFEQVGNIVKFHSSDSTKSKAVIESYDWLTCTVRVIEYLDGPSPDIDNPDIDNSVDGINRQGPDLFSPDIDNPDIDNSVDGINRRGQNLLSDNDTGPDELGVGLVARELADYLASASLEPPFVLGSRHY